MQEFVLSAGQAHQLELAFRRCNWTAADVQRLCKDATLSEVKNFLLREMADEALRENGSKHVRDVFTPERAMQMGYAPKIAARVVRALTESCEVDTLSELVFHTREELLLSPAVGDESLKFVKEVLAEYGLKLGMPLHKF